MHISFDQVKNKISRPSYISRKTLIYSSITSQRLRIILAKLQIKKTTTTDESIIAMEWSRSCLLLVMEFLLDVLRITLNVRLLKMARRKKGMMTIMMKLAISK
jgi:hypothetical protein